MATGLRQPLTLPHLIVYGVGTMVGAGIYSVIGPAAGEAGAALWISFCLAGTIAFLTVLAYGELAALFPRAGAEYQYLKAAFPRLPLVGVLTGYLIALSAAATSATVALAFAGYLDTFIELPNVLVAFGLLALCTVINITGIRPAAWVISALVMVEVGGLLLVIGAGWIAGDWSRPAMPDPAELPGGVFAATALLFFLYIGFEDVTNLSEEAKDPKRTIPRALVISTALTTGLYLLIAFAATALSPPGEMAASGSSLAAAAGKADPRLAPAVAVAALFATASTALISLVSISRLLAALARDGDMPRSLAWILPRRKTPWVAALALFGAAFLLLPLGSIKVVASVSAFSVLMVFIAVQAAVIGLRFSASARSRPFRIPLSIGKLPVPPVIVIIAATALLTQFEWRVYAIGFGIIGLGTLTHLVRGGRKRRQSTAAGHQVADASP